MHFFVRGIGVVVVGIHANGLADFLFDRHTHSAHATTLLVNRGVECAAEVRVVHQVTKDKHDDGKIVHPDNDGPNEKTRFGIRAHDNQYGHCDCSCK